MIVFSDVTKSFERRFPILENINFEIKSGEFVFLTGVSGSGKTTVMNMIYRFTFPDSGHIYFEQSDICSKRINNAVHRSRIGYVLQSTSLLEKRSIEYNVSLPQYIIGAKKAKRQEQVDKALNLCCISHLRKFNPVSVSGGEKQLTALARAIVNEPDVILADEPTANLDRKMALTILNLLLRLNEQGTTIIFCTHDAELIKAYSTRILLIKNKQINDYQV